MSVVWSTETLLYYININTMGCVCRVWSIASKNTRFILIVVFNSCSINSIMIVVF